MAQIIRHRRGSLESLSSVTSSFQKGELIIVSGSSNITSSNGSSIVFAANESGSVQAVNRFLIGDSAPNVFPAGTYNGLVKGVPYYASGSSTLYLLGTDGNQAINLEGNIQSFSASVATSLNNLSASIGSGDIGNSVNLLNSKTGSYATTGSNVFFGEQTISSSAAELRLEDSTSGNAFHIRNYGGDYLSIHKNDGQSIVRFESGSGINGMHMHIFGDTLVSGRVMSLGGFSGSVDGIGNVTEFSTSVDYRLDSIEGSLGSGGSIGSRVSALETSSANLNSFSSSVNSSLTNLNSFTESFSQSVATSFSASNASITSLSASVASVTGDFSSSVATSFSASEASQLLLSQSVATSFSASAASVAADQSAQNTRIDSLSNFTGSYATTGSNIFYGTQVITGSMYITQDLIVQGSSSLQYITASAVDLGTNTIILNNDSPSVRFGGISVVDSGSSQATGSLFYDSLKNHWIVERPSSSTEVANSAVLIYGPISTGSLGDETLLTPGKIMVATGEDHIGSSIMTQTTGKITLDGGLDVTGEISSSTIAGLGNVTEFSQSVDGRLDTIETSLGGGGGIGTRVSTLETSSANVNSFTSSQLTQNSTLATYTGSVETRLTEVGVVSGSLIASASAAKTTNDAQDVSITNLNTFSGSQLTQNSTLSTYTGSVETRLTEIGVVSGSLIASASTAKSTNDAQGVSITNLNTFSGSSLDRLSNLETTSASVNTSVSALNSSSASQQISIDALNVVSSSNLNRLSNLELTSASVNTSISNLNISTSELNTFSASAKVELSNLESKSASVDISIAALNSYTSSNASTTALNNFTASADGRLDNLESKSASVDVSISNINATTESLNISVSNLNTFSASVNTSVSALNSSSASQQVSLDNLNAKTGSYATTGSNTFFGTQTISGSVNVSGSTNFNGAVAVNDSNMNLGNSSSLNLTGGSSIYVNGGGVISGSIVGIGNVTAFSTSVDTRLDSLESAVGAGSNIDGRLNNLESTSASVNISVSNINSFTSSAEGRLSNLESTSASVNTSVSALNSSSASQQISIDALNVVSSSNLDRLSQLETASGSAKVSITELNAYSSSLKTAISVSGSNVTINGDFTVTGTQTIVDSTTVQIGDNIIELNGSGAANGGLYVKDATNPNTATGSLLWDSTNDYWKAGVKGAEIRVALMGGDNLVTASQQILLTQVDGYTTFSSSITNDFSSSNASITALSASVASVTGDFSSSVATSFSASNASITALSASVASVTGDFSSSVATSFSASAASQTLLSSSFASSQNVQDGRLDNLETKSGSVDVSISNLNSFTSSINTTIQTKLDLVGVFSSSVQTDITATTGFTSYSGSVATEISASNARILVLETTIDGGTY